MQEPPTLRLRSARASRTRSPAASSFPDRVWMKRALRTASGCPARGSRSPAAIGGSWIDRDAPATRRSGGDCLARTALRDVRGDGGTRSDVRAARRPAHRAGGSRSASGGTGGLRGSSRRSRCLLRRQRAVPSGDLCALGQWLPRGGSERPAEAPAPLSAAAIARAQPGLHLLCRA